MKTSRLSSELLFVVAALLAGRSQAQGPNTQLNITQASVLGAVGILPSVNSFIAETRVVADSQGNTYAAGTFAGQVSFGSITLTSAGGSDVFVTKRDAAGAYLWAVQGGGPDEQRCANLAVDAAGNVYVTGNFTSQPTATFGSFAVTNQAPANRSGSDVFVAKLNGQTHTWQWAASAGGSTNINGADYGAAVAVDATGNVYVAGTFDSSVAFFGPSIQVYHPQPGFRNIFVAKLDAAGTWLWARGQEYMGFEAAGLAVDAAADVYLTGVHSRTAVFDASTLTTRGVSPFVAKISAAGFWQWAAGAPASQYSGTPSISEARPDGVGSVYIAGHFVGDTLRMGAATLVNNGARDSRNGLTGDAYAARLDARTGAWRWAVQSTGMGSEHFSGPPLPDGSGHVYVGGSFGEPSFNPTANAGNTFGATTLHSAGEQDLVVAQLDTAGRWQWARQAGSSYSEYGVLTTLAGQGYCRMWGAFTGPSTRLGPFALAAYPSAGAYGTYVTVLLGTNGPLAGQPTVAQSAFAVFPNPAHMKVTVAGLPPQQAVQILDVLGRRVLHGTVPVQGELELRLPTGLPPGVYVATSGVQMQRLVIE